MKLEDQVCNLKLAKKLKELGVIQDADLYWVSGEPHFWNEHLTDKECYLGWKGNGISPIGINFDGNGDFRPSTDYLYAAFNVPELGLILPPTIAHGEDLKEFYRQYWSNQAGDFHYVGYSYCGGIVIGGIEGETEADARAKMLIHLIEKGIVKP